MSVDTTTVLALSIGPVQPFIEAARRFSDLAIGSRILSDLAREASRGAASVGADLVFPAEVADQGSVANKVLAICASSQIARRAAEAARTAMSSLWKDLTGQVLREFDAYLVRDAFLEQARFDDWCEFFAAWATRPTYAEARDAAERLLEGRKRTRDFVQRTGRPVAKSWQDPGREDVLVRNENRLEVLRRRLLVKGQERLDALCAIKRLHPEREGFASVNEIALAPALAAARPSQALADFEAAVREVTGHSIDPAWYYPDRLRVEALDAGYHPEDIGRLFKLLRKARFTPTPYYALVLADGDGMGEAIAKLHGHEDHRVLSRNMAGFARKVRETFNGSADGFYGKAVYAGGDDVLAVFPLDGVLSGVDRIATFFKDEVPGHSISVGIVIAHMLEPFDRVRQWAQDAERMAKTWRRRRDGGAGAVAIRLQKRSGEPRSIVGWLPGEGGGMVDALAQARELFRAGTLSEGTPYDLIRGSRDVPDAARLSLARHTLDRRRTRNPDAILDQQNEASLQGLVDWAAASTGREREPHAIDVLASLLVVARFLESQSARTGG